MRSIVALVTPFNHKGIDEDALRRLVNYHLESGTDGILVAGCTGESFTLTPRERNRLLNITKEQTEGRVPVILGTGSSSQAQAIEMSKNASDLGVDYVLVISPYGNKPSQTAIYDYYTEIAKVSPPLIVYNVPGRTGRGIDPDTIVELADVDNIVGVKEASGDLDAVSYILKHRPEFKVWSGDDSLTLPMLALGAYGVISTVANIMPVEMKGMIEAFLSGDIKRAQKLHMNMFPVIKALFLEGNPVPLKEAMNLMGQIVGDCRKPLGRMGEHTREILVNVLYDGGYLK